MYDCNAEGRHEKQIYYVKEIEWNFRDVIFFFQECQVFDWDAEGEDDAMGQFLIPLTRELLHVCRRRKAGEDDATASQRELWYILFILYIYILYIYIYIYMCTYIYIDI